MALRPFPVRAWRGIAILGVALLSLAGCTVSDIPKQLKPVPAALAAKMDQLGMKETSPIFIRLFKESSELEVWKQQSDGEYALLKTYGICKWSGALGPKKVEGDRQAPEGFYTVTPAQMNPNSSYYLSFNMGFPNAYDRALGRTGTNLMVHGACSSAGCYSMTDEAAGEIFALARDSFRGGQAAFQIQAFPFRMTPDNLARHRDDPNMAFWQMLKEGSDNFELTRRPPKVDVCDKRYVFNAEAGEAKFDASRACPSYVVPEKLVAALAQKKAEDDARFRQQVALLADKEKSEARQQQAAAERAIADEKTAAERAANPGPIARLLGARPAPVATGDAVAITPAKVSAAVAITPARVSAREPAIVAVPRPKLKPDIKAMNPVVPAASGAAEPAPAATADSPGITPAMTSDIPAVGKFVKKKFDWPEDKPAKPSG